MKDENTKMAIKVGLGIAIAGGAYILYNYFFGSKKQSEPEKPKTLYEKFGGHEGIGKVVEKFYEHVLADNTVSHFFKNTNMTKQKVHQTNFVSLCLGGPNKYEGRNMREAHAGMKLTDKEFNAIATHLSNTLKSFGVSNEDIDATLKIVETTRKDVLNL